MELNHLIERVTDVKTYTHMHSWSEPTLFGVDSDRLICEEILARRFKAAWWSPGLYRLTVSRTGHGGIVARHQVRLPMPLTWSALSRTSRAFGSTVLDRYPGTTHALVADQLSTFRRHYHGEIDNRTLAITTGYVIPAGCDPRPAWARRAHPVSPRR